MKLDLGTRANGKKVDGVKLPKWARTPEEFLRKQKEALESEYVSQNLHLWIDLIFGIKQCSIEDNNVFHPCTYQDKVKKSVLNDPV
jgi:factor associated with neutral sphingomyelinase activation